MVQAMIRLSEDANRILNVVRAEYGLKDKSRGSSEFFSIMVMICSSPNSDLNS